MYVCRSSRISHKRKITKIIHFEHPKLTMVIAHALESTSTCTRRSQPSFFPPSGHFATRWHFFLRVVGSRCFISGTARNEEWRRPFCQPTECRETNKSKEVQVIKDRVGRPLRLLFFFFARVTRLMMFTYHCKLPIVHNLSNSIHALMVLLLLRKDPGPSTWARGEKSKR